MEEQRSRKPPFFPHPLSPPLDKQTPRTSGTHMDPVQLSHWACQPGGAPSRANFKPRLSKITPPSPTSFLYHLNKGHGDFKKWMRVWGLAGNRRVVPGDGLPLEAEQPLKGHLQIQATQPCPRKRSCWWEEGSPGPHSLVTWRELEGKSTEQVSISPFSASSQFLRVCCILDTVIGSHLIPTTAL